MSLVIVIEILTMKLKDKESGKNNLVVSLLESVLTNKMVKFLRQ